LAERGIWWQIGGFAVVSAVGVALLVEFGGSETRAYRYFEAAVRTMYWANVFVLIGLFEGVRRMFEKASTLRARYWEQAEKRATERGLKRGLKTGLKTGLKQGREAAREEARTRMQQALERFGVEVNGVRMLPDTPEVQKFLDGEAD
jgi:hypothetical protein